jgi:hypothetical protein
MFVKRLALGALVLALGAPSHSRDRVGVRGGGEISALAVNAAGEWHTWWRSDSAPVRWSEPLGVVARAVEWHSVDEGVEVGELRLSGSGEAWRVRVILVRVDPTLVRFQLDSGFENGLQRAAWTIDRAPAAALVAFNAGQFSGSLPWGWVVLRGREFLPPGHGPLSTAVSIDTAGVLRWSPPDSIPSLRRARGVAAAFQSYPTLLEGDGDVPLALRPDSHIAGVSLDHGDSRLAIGTLRDGRVLVALTRFDGLDGFLDAIPLGLTTPQTAALMGALGCGRAVMLDGGISSQLLVRGSAGGVQRWPGIRHVPLGLVALPRKGREKAESREQKAGTARKQETGNGKQEGKGNG